MPQQGLASFIVTYIEGRRQPKLEAFDKDAQKKLAAATEAEQGVLQQQLAQERRDLEQRYEVRAWLTDAAARGQISLVTHAAKYTHSDAKGSSVYGQGKAMSVTCQRRRCQNLRLMRLAMPPRWMSQNCCKPSIKAILCLPACSDRIIRR